MNFLNFQFARVMQFSHFSHNLCAARFDQTRKKHLHYARCTFSCASFVTNALLNCVTQCKFVITPIASHTHKCNRSSHNSCRLRAVIAQYCTTLAARGVLAPKQEKFMAQSFQRNEVQGARELIPRLATTICKKCVIATNNLWQSAGRQTHTGLQ